VDPALIPNLIRIRNTHNPSKESCFQDIDHHKSYLCIPDPSFLDVARQTEDFTLEFCDRFQTAQEAIASLQDESDLANCVWSISSMKEHTK